MGLQFKTLNQITDLSSVLPTYNELIVQVFGGSHLCTLADLEEIKERPKSELLLFMYLGDLLIGTAFASFASRPPYPKAYVDSVVVDSSVSGYGHGSKLMRELHRQSLKRWPNITMFQLTSSPKRNTQNFYERLGYFARTHNSGNPTVAFVKKVAAHV